MPRTYSKQLRPNRLSPMLFNLFIEDISDIFINQIDTDPMLLQGQMINHFLHADDLFIVSESAKGLQTCLDKLGLYAEQSKTMVSTQRVILSKNNLV